MEGNLIYSVQRLNAAARSELVGEFLSISWAHSYVFFFFSNPSSTVCVFLKVKLYCPTEGDLCACRTKHYFYFTSWEWTYQQVGLIHIVLRYVQEALHTFVNTRGELVNWPYQRCICKLSFCPGFGLKMKCISMDGLTVPARDLSKQHFYDYYSSSDSQQRIWTCWCFFSRRTWQHTLKWTLHTHLSLQWTIMSMTFLILL